MTTTVSDTRSDAFAINMLSRITGDEELFYPKPSHTALASTLSPLSFPSLAHRKTSSVEDCGLSMSNTTVAEGGDSPVTRVRGGCVAVGACAQDSAPVFVRAAPPVSVTTADLPAPLLHALLAYGEEIISSSLGEEEKEKKGQEEEGDVVQFITARVSGENADFFYPQFAHLKENFRACKNSLHVDHGSNFPFAARSKSYDSAALLWFLSEYSNLAATTLKMGNCFLFGLRRWRADWKKEVEIPFMALQLLATFVHTFTQTGAEDRTRRSFSEWGLREHLIGVAACLYIAWKFVDVDAHISALVDLLERRYFGAPSVLHATDILQAELAIMRLCGLRVTVPRWLTVAMEVLTAYTIEKGEATALHEEKEEGEEREAMGRLDRLLCACEAVLVLLMAPGRGGGRLRDWVRSHLLFGVALSAASGAVEAPWAAALVAPAAHGTGGGAPRAIRAADRAAQKALAEMITYTKEAMREMETREAV